MVHNVSNLSLAGKKSKNIILLKNFHSLSVNLDWCIFLKKLYYVGDKETEWWQVIKEPAPFLRPNYYLYDYNVKTPECILFVYALWVSLRLFLPSSKYCFPYFKHLIKWTQCKVRWYTLWKTIKLQTTPTSIMNQFSLCHNFPKGFPLGLKFSKLHFSSKPNDLIHLNLEKIQLNISAECMGAAWETVQVWSLS